MFAVNAVLVLLAAGIALGIAILASGLLPAGRIGGPDPRWPMVLAAPWAEPLAGYRLTPRPAPRSAGPTTRLLLEGGTAG